MARVGVAATRIGLVVVAARWEKPLDAPWARDEELAKGDQHEHAIAGPTSEGPPAAFRQGGGREECCAPRPGVYAPGRRNRAPAKHEAQDMAQQHEAQDMAHRGGGRSRWRRRWARLVEAYADR